MADIVCMQCRYIGKPKRIKRGSKQLEMIGWMLFPIGLPYTLWRMIAKKPVCKMCASEFIMPAKSAVGQRLIRIASGGPAIETPPLPAPVSPASTDSLIREKRDTIMPMQQASSNSVITPLPSSNQEPTIHIMASAANTEPTALPEKHTHKPSVDPDVW